MKLSPLTYVATAAILLLCAGVRAQSFPDPKTGGGHVPAPQTGDSIAVQPPHTDDSMAHRIARPSTFIVVDIHGKASTFRLSDLQSMPQQTLTVLNGHTKTRQTYTGPSVGDVLARAGLLSTPEAQHAMLHQVVVATGTDRYFVVYSAAELSPVYSNEASIVALTLDGQPLVDGGSFMLVHAGEKKPARWVRNLVGLSLRDIAQ